MNRFRLDEIQQARATSAATSALAFCADSGHDLAAALIRYLWHRGDPDEAGQALGRYQNPDGGFGRRLEPDLHDPSSNPFATRIAMMCMLALPRESTQQLHDGLRRWLRTNQAGNGDFPLTEETRSGFLYPWFRDWEPPKLDPACPLIGMGRRLGLTSPETEQRVASLFQSLATVEMARHGRYYEVLAITEYAIGVDFPGTDRYLDAVAAHINANGTKDDAYQDPLHFWGHALGGPDRLIARLDPVVLSRWTDRLLDNQQGDGGWPDEYDDIWRPWYTAYAMWVLSRLRDGVPCSQPVVTMPNSRVLNTEVAG